MSNNKFKILVVDDENNILSLITTVLEANGYFTVTASSCAIAEMLYSSHHPDLVILDLGLPDKDGLEFIEWVRKTSFTPVIVLSARNSETDKIAALDLGANDYVTKPFGTGELLARIRAVLRSTHHSGDDKNVSGDKFVISDLVVNYPARTVYLHNREIKFTQTEYNIVALLAENAGKMMTYSAIIKAVWGEATDASSIKKLQVNMANIRKKLGLKPGEGSYIVNELNVGYRMRSTK